MTKLRPYEVGAKTGDSSNVATLQRAAETQHPDVAMLQRAAEMQHPDIATLLHDVVMVGVLGRFLAHFEPIIVGFKAQTLETTKMEDLGRIFGVFEGEQDPFGWKHSRACS